MKGQGRQQDFAVGLGVSVNLSKAYWPVWSAAGLLCPQGRCFTFDECAMGHVRGEGCGALMVKLMSENVDGQEVASDTNIIGMLASGCQNHNGRSASLTAPNAA